MSATPLTLDDYMSIVKRCLDISPALDNDRWPDSMIVARLNDAQQEIVRETDLFFFRNSTSSNAVSGEITPPAEYFSDLILTLVVSASDRRHLPIKTAKQMYKEQPNWATIAASQYPSQAIIKNTPSGIRFVLNPPISATITNGLFWDYAALPTDMEEPADECDVLGPFPELQATLLPAGALKALYLLDAGTSDLQWKKWDLFFQQEMDRLRSAMNDLYVQEGTYNRG